MAVVWVMRAMARRVQAMVMALPKVVTVVVRAMQHAAANSSCAVHAEVAERTARSGAVDASR